jgi:hypothetical protein
MYTDEEVEGWSRRVSAHAERLVAKLKPNSAANTRAVQPHRSFTVGWLQFLALMVYRVSSQPVNSARIRTSANPKICSEWMVLPSSGQAVCKPHTIHRLRKYPLQLKDTNRSIGCYV